MKKQYKYLLFAGGLYLTGFLFLRNRTRRKNNVEPETMLYPVSNVKVTSNFGNRIDPITKQPSVHNGTDFAGNVGDNIFSPYDGIVTGKNTTDRGGNQLFIKHNNGLTSGFAHLSKYHVQPGQLVKRGQLVAEIGNTGKVTGAHLHYTLKNDSGLYLNPVKFLA